MPDVPLWYAPLAAFYGFLLWGTRVVRSMNDALGLTVPGELLRSGVNLLGAIIILALFWFGFLNAGSLFGLQYLMMGSIVIAVSYTHLSLRACASSAPTPTPRALTSNSAHFRNRWVSGKPRPSTTAASANISGWPGLSPCTA